MNVFAASSGTKLGSEAPSLAGWSVPARSLATFLVGTLALQQLLLWSFLGLSPATIVAGALVAGGLCVACLRFGRADTDSQVGISLIGSCFLFSLLLFALGGEGRFFYANTDWQVRNAVLHDLVLNPWPFAYAVNGQVDVLRAPLGLYLIPATAGKIAGLRAAELMMLVQSAAILSCILSLASTLFTTLRERIGTMIVFFVFSGMDALPMASMGGWAGIHLEGWGPLQYSSHITQAFWVPMHALAGWIGAVLYLLWRTNRLSLAAFLTPIPLLALLSPLALIGIIPFAAQAGIAALWSRSLKTQDILLPAASVLLSLPSLLYLASGTSAVGGQVTPLTFHQWAKFELVEVVPYMAAVILLRGSTRFGAFLPLMVSAILLVLPLGQVGGSSDLTSRASIPALAILAVLVAELMLRPPDHMRSRLMRAVVIATLVIGLLTPLTELYHAVSRPRQAIDTCSYFGVVPAGAPTYVTQLEQIPGAIRPSGPAILTPSDPASCKEVSWFAVEERFHGGAGN